MWDYDTVDFESLKGKIITKINAEPGNDVVTIITNDGCKYNMFHQQDCCESVYVQDVIGDTNDLVGYPLTMAEEVVSEEDPEDFNDDDLYRDSYTWTFYKLATVKGYVTIRWYGTSNGYYSESVDFVKEPSSKIDVITDIEATGFYNWLLSKYKVHKVALSDDLIELCDKANQSCTEAINELRYNGYIPYED